MLAAARSRASDRRENGEENIVSENMARVRLSLIEVVLTVSQTEGRSWSQNPSTVERNAENRYAGEREARGGEKHHRDEWKGADTRVLGLDQPLMALFQ